MLILDVKDFRKFSTCPVQITEEQVAAVLQEAGAGLESLPLCLRLRIKDMDMRRIPAKADLLDTVGSEFRLNLYFPPWELDEEDWNYINSGARHLIKHLAQIRVNGGPISMDKAEALCEQAEVFAQTSTNLLVSS